MALLGAIALSHLSGCSGWQTREARIVHDAAAALGGANVVRDVRTMTAEGAGEVFALGQNRTLDGPLLQWHVTGYRRAIDVDRGRWRDELTQTAAFVTGWPDPTPVVAGYDDDVAFDVDGGQASRLDATTARDRRAELYHHPIGFLRAALATGARLDRARTEGDQDAVDLIVATGERYTLYVDRHSHVPQRIVSKSDVPPLADVTVETTFSAFIGAASGGSAGAPGVKVPSRITTRVADAIVKDVRLTKVLVNPAPNDMGDLQAPPDARAASASRPARVTPITSRSSKPRSTIDGRSPSSPGPALFGPASR
jgi:hypothetical protein